ncbi:MAG: CoA pyrophosphatase [Amaricoccus sp.]|uniref:NUDIX hydrolase n=1 Tax=Amaricoccus sp. TaxID=1872485 RepID=UPI0033158FEF
MDRHCLNVTRIAAALRAPSIGTSDFDLNPAARPSGSFELRPASVLVPLIERGAGINIILTRRAAHLRHHPGQIAFPGGRQDPTDPTPLDAALREAREEIGLAREQVTILGGFDTHETVTRFSVSPFVGLVDADFTPVIDRAEVEEVFEAPLAFVLDPANRQTHRRAWPGGWRRYQAIPYGPHYIWGATARMLISLGDRMRGL